MPAAARSRSVAVFDKIRLGFAVGDGAIREVGLMEWGRFAALAALVRLTCIKA